MQYCKKSVFFVAVAIFLMTTVTTPALAQEDLLSGVSGETMAFDFFVLRPLGLVTTVGGCALYIVSFPFTIWSGKNHKRALHHFIVVPGAYTFGRPLGEVNEKHHY